MVLRYVSPRKLTRKGDQDLGARKPRRELMEASRMLWGCHSGTWRRLRAPLVPADPSRKQMLWGPRKCSHEASLMPILSAGPSRPASPTSRTHTPLLVPVGGGASSDQSAKGPCVLQRSLRTTASFSCAFFPQEMIEMIRHVSLLPILLHVCSPFPLIPTRLIKRTVHHCFQNL